MLRQFIVSLMLFGAVLPAPSMKDASQMMMTDPELSPATDMADQDEPLLMNIDDSIAMEQMMMDQGVDMTSQSDGVNDEHIEITEEEMGTVPLDSSDLDSMSIEQMEALNEQMKRALHRARRSVDHTMPSYCNHQNAYAPECSPTAGVSGLSDDNTAPISAGGSASVSSSFSNVGDSGAGVSSQTGNEGPVVGVSFSHDNCVEGIEHVVREAVRFIPVTIYNTKFLVLHKTVLSTMKETAYAQVPVIQTVTRTVALPSVALTSTIVINQLRPVQISTVKTIVRAITTTKPHTITDIKTLYWTTIVKYANDVTTTFTKTMDVSRDGSDLITETRYSTVTVTRTVQHTITHTSTNTVVSDHIIQHVAHQYKYIPATPTPVYVTKTVRDYCTATAMLNR